MPACGKCSWIWGPAMTTGESRKERQAIALENPCRMAFETAHPRFCYVDYPHCLSIIITINSGYE